jgi:site-specific DNA-methyltransferase (adenine-specific)
MTKLGKVLHSEAQEALSEMEAESFEACVTDPPYELGFMGKSWDESGIAFDPEFWEEVYRVLKPGAHLLSFGGTRTHHRMMAAIEDAGFEIRDTLTWHYGGGFPKATDMSKTIDRRKGKFDEREVVSTRKETSGLKRIDEKNKDHGFRPNEYFDDEPDVIEETEPATEEAKRWEGWKTGLKPATEFICMARKPFGGATVDALLEYGVGALNVDDCRIGVDPNDENIRENWQEHERSTSSIFGEADGAAKNFDGREGRYPANLLMDDRASTLMDEQSGELYSASAVYGTEDGGESLFGSGEGGRKTGGHDATGGASRFFYCPKASTSERNLGVEENDHPTVKPVELMGYLIRLVTPDGGKVLDPFGGSGTTGMAAVLEQKEFVIVEKNEDSVKLSENRIKHVEDNYQRVREKIYGDPSNQITDKQTEVNDHNFW